MNKTCLVIGNGPSLADIPNSFLSQYATFGSNRCYLKFVPDYYAWIDPLWIGGYIKEISDLRSKKFIAANFAELVVGATPLYNNQERSFSYDPFEWIHEGYTVTYVLLQLAYYYGYERVGLIGVDHYYEVDGEPATKQVGKDKNHFTEDYYSESDHWWRPDLEKVEESYLIAKDVYEADGREIINITPNSALTVFPKENWNDW